MNSETVYLIWTDESGDGDWFLNEQIYFNRWEADDAAVVSRDSDPQSVLRIQVKRHTLKGPEDV